MKVALYESTTVATYEKNGEFVTEKFNSLTTKSPKKSELVNDVNSRLELEGIDTILSIVPTLQKSFISFQTLLYYKMQLK